MATGRITVPMPQMGVSVEEGTVLSWHHAEGDTVAVDDVLCEIATDKVDTEVLAPADGVVAKLHAAAGETVKVGAPLAELAVDVAAAVDASEPEAPGPVAERQCEPGAPQPAAALAGADRAPALVGTGRRYDPVAAAEAAVPVASRNGRTVASPVARRLAAEHGVAIEELVGSGLRGRIRKADVLAALAAPSTPESAPPPAAAPVAAGGIPRGYDDVPFEAVTLTHQRRAIAEHMVRSRQTAAHMTTEVEVDMSAVARARAELNERRVAAGASKLSYLPLMARATCAALAEYPILNATFDGDRMLLWSEINLGIAVDTPAGLLVPVIRNCERLTAPAIGDAIADLAERARTRKLVPDDLRAGTFTLSNPGSVGAASAMAIINQPQVAILGMPAIIRRPVVVTDAHGAETIGIRPMMTLALTFDHRAVDGAEATRGLAALKQRLETWDARAYA
jgi:2-oxoglutarate dehydrogenase E2 component (dihydrolipoamide succinyltransferase)